MMQWCNVHHRALIPEGFDLRQRVSVPARWHAVPLGAIALAQAYAAAFQYAGEIEVHTVPCDRCAEENAA